MSDPARNLYAPPGGAVADAEPLSRLSIPLPIAQSMWLMAAALGVWALLFIFDPLANPHSWQYYADTLIPLLILETWLWFEIRGGANWARIAQAVIVVVAGVVMLPALVELAQSERLLASIEIVDAFLAVASLYLLFGPGRWARTVFIALALLGFLQVCYSVGVGYRTLGEDWHVMLQSLFVLSAVLPAMLGLVAVHLLYFSSGDWFRRRSLAGSP